MTKVSFNLLSRFVQTMVLLAMVCLFPFESRAQLMNPVEPANICSDGPQFNTTPPGEGVFTHVTNMVRAQTNGLGKNLFERIVKDSGFKDAVGAALTIYVAIFAILFMTGQARVSALDFVTRLVKISIIALMLAGQGWNFFNTYLGNFLNALVDEYSGQLALVTIGSSQSIAGENNFPGIMQLMDVAVSQVISINMMLHLLAIFFTPPYGFFYLILLIIGLWSFLSLLTTAIWVYLTTLVFRGLLLGFAPIFIVFLLFERTRGLFDGWLNQLLSATIQPILLFSFLAFFILMTIGLPGQNSGLINHVLEVPVCWTTASQSLTGSPFNIQYWRFAVRKEGNIESGTSEYEPYGGQWSWGGRTEGGGPVFPIDLWPLLTFLIMAELGKRFGQTVLIIARDLSSSNVDFSDMGNAFRGLLPTSASGPTASQSAINKFRSDAAREGVVSAFKRNIGNLFGRG